MHFVAGATLPDFSVINFRGPLGGLFQWPASDEVDQAAVRTATES